MGTKLLVAYRKSLEMKVTEAPSDLPAHWQDRLWKMLPIRKKHIKPDHEMGQADRR